MVPFTAALTAGGRSSRFGTDKALAVWRGQTFIEHAASALEGGAPKLLIAPIGRYALAGWETVPDLRPGEGPLAALEAALTVALQGWVAFAGVDQPTLTPGYWETLLHAVRDGFWSVQPVDDKGQRQPLGALYHTDALPYLQGRLGAGERRLREAVPQKRCLLVEGLSPHFFQNVNTVADLRLLERGNLT